MRSFCYENEVSFICKVELITITKTSHLDSLWRGGRHELGNGLLARRTKISLFLCFVSLSANKRKRTFFFHPCACASQPRFHGEINALMLALCACVASENQALIFAMFEILITGSR